MNDYYSGREQSEAKHEILRRYLVPFANKILHGWHSLDFIDGFAGPWEHRDTNDLSDTSIGVSLETLSEVAKARGHTPLDQRIRCVFNEKSPNAFGQLSAYVERCRHEYPLLKIEVFKGEFAENAPAIRRISDHSFRLLFVDPTGYTGFPPEALKLFAGRSTEIIVNFMRKHMVRFVSGNHADRETALVGLLGNTRAQYLLDTGLTIETVEEEYLKLLRADLGYQYSGMSPIHDKEHYAIHFHLAYATNHPDGMDVMRNAEFGALSDYDRTRFNKKQTKVMDDLFGNSEDMDVVGPYLQTRKLHMLGAPTEALALAKEHPSGVPFNKFAATLQQNLYLKRSEIGDVLADLAQEGAIVPTWLDRSSGKRSGRKPTMNDLILPK